MSFETEIRELTGQYWDIAFHEGKSGKSNGDLAGKILHNIEEAVSRMQAEVEALRKDAARYQALRRGQKWSVIDGIGDTLRAEGLDEAIDTAIAKDTQEQA
jgi:hypothetical protein